MKVWRRKLAEQWGERGVARAALRGASRDELLREAVAELASQGAADRIGVWIEAAPNSRSTDETSGTLHGLLWDAESSETPAEWNRLSLEPPLPKELLLGAKSFEQDLGDSAHPTLIGPLLGLRHALWVPIERAHQLQGVILLGSRRRESPKSTAHAEAVASELSLAIQREEERGFARNREVDLGIVRQILSAQSRTEPPEQILAQLADSCTQPQKGLHGLGAAFAAIGTPPEFPETTSWNGALEFRWRSGDLEWAAAIEREPLSGIWQKALAERRVIGSEPPSAWPQSAVARIVALPLAFEDEILGVLLAGLSSQATSLASLERLELHAALAAGVLGRKKREQEKSRQADWQERFFKEAKELFFLLDEAGKILAVSRGAKALAAQSSRPEQTLPDLARPGERLALLFRPRERAQVESWLRRISTGDADASVADDSPPLELQNGLRVRLRMAAPRLDNKIAVALEPLAAAETARPADRAETELQNVLEWLEEGVVLFDAQENIRAMNMRFQQIVGLAPEESGSLMTLEALIHRLEGQAEDPGHFAERWRQLARGMEGGLREELRLQRPAPRTLERAARPILDGIGRQLGRVEIYRDLAAQQLFQSKLLQTEKLAALGQMVSGIAHELSNPLTSILGYAQRALARPGASGFREEALRILQEAERGTGILRQVLHNARDTQPERRPVSLNQIVLRAMEHQRFTLAAEKIRVELDLDPVLPFVQGDPGQLQQVLLNLVANAQQAIEYQDGGGTIRLRTRRSGEQRVLLEVEDTGPGIPQAIQARIFDPFFTTKPPGVGTGLGLSIVLSVVREHGGQIHVVSPAQGGTRFRIEFPAAVAAPAEALPVAVGLPAPDQLHGPAAGVEWPSGRDDSRFVSARGNRVLVVEDEPTVARLIGDVLEDEGMRVDILLDGHEALDRAARESYDLVICDMKMPGLDGQNFYKSLARTGNPLRDHFLFVTGDIVAAPTHEFLERNHIPHVAKPFRVEELMEKVYRVLGQSLPASPVDAERKNAARNG